MHFPHDLASFFELLAKLPQQKIAKGISALLLIYIAYLAAQVTWMLVPQEQANKFSPTSVTTNTSNTAFKANLSGLNALNLFGEYGEEPVEQNIEIQDAPETRLNLTLSGVVASDVQSTAAAIIENNGKQETYGIGETITGTRAVLNSVANDRVLIKQSGRLETLMLDGFDYDKAAYSTPRALPKSTNKKNTKSRYPNKAKARVIDQRSNRELSKRASTLKKDINEDPGKITNHLKIAPKRTNGKVIGYRLMPGKKPEFFKASGLKSGDVAVQMNGFDLSEPSEAAQAMRALKQEKEVSLLVDRNGEMTEILFSIN